MRVFIAGFQHETNTFAPSKADWPAFTSGAGWLPYMRGPVVLERYRGKTMRHAMGRPCIVALFV